MFEKYRNLSKKDIAVNLILYAIGVCIMPLGVILTVNSKCGAGGCDAFYFAVSAKTGFNIDIVMIVCSVAVILITAFIRKGRPRFTTFISSFFLAEFTRLWQYVLRSCTTDKIIFRYLMFIAGMTVIAFAVSAYVISIFPSNPTDDFVAALTERGVKIGIAKIAFDAFFVAMALLIDRNQVGIGTLICTFGLGTEIGFFSSMIKKFLSHFNLIESK